MLFTLVDVILLMLITAGMVVGATLGLIQAIGALVGIGAGIFALWLWLTPVSNWLAGWMLERQDLARTIAFFLIFGLAHRLVGLAFYFVDRTFKLISWLPFLGPFNKLLGGIFGLIESILAAAVVIYLLARFIPDSLIVAAFDQSIVAHTLVRILGLIVSFIPGLG